MGRRSEYVGVARKSDRAVKAGGNNNVLEN